MIIFDTNIVAPWVCARCESPQTQGMRTIGLVQDGVITAGVMYNHFTGRAIEASIAVEGVKPCKTFWNVIFDYPFNQLGVEKIIVRINTANKRSVKLAMKLGFELAGVITDIYDDGDLILATLVKQDCKMLRRSHGIKIEST